MRALQSIRAELPLGPQASATTARTAAIDTQNNGGSVLLLIPVSAEANTNSTNVIIDVLHSDDTVVTNHVSLGTNLLDNTAAIVQPVFVDMNGKKRHLRVTATPDTTTNGAVIVGGVIVVKDVDVAPSVGTTGAAVIRY